MKNRWVWSAVVVLIVLVAVGALFVNRGQAEPDSRQIADAIAGGREIKLPGGEKLLAQSPASTYFSLAPGKARDEFLDQMIDQQEQMRKKIASGEIKLPISLPKNANEIAAAEERGEIKGSSVETRTSPDGTQKSVTVRLNADDLSPALRAQMEEFAGALRQRRKDRGLDPDAPMMIVRTESKTVSK